MNQGIPAVLLIASKKKKKKKSWRASRYHEPVWLKQGMIMDATELYVVLVVCVTLTFIQDPRDGRKKALLR